VQEHKFRKGGRHQLNDLRARQWTRQSKVDDEGLMIKTNRWRGLTKV
jgi:hypothetical protein